MYPHQPRPSEAALKAALAFVLRAELTPGKVSSRIMNEATFNRLNALPEPWKGMALATLKQRASTLSAEQLATVDDAAGKIYTAMTEDEHVVLPFTDEQLQAITRLTSAEMAAEGFAKTATGQVYAELFGSYVRVEKEWKDFAASHQGRFKQTVTLLDDVDALRQAADNQLRMLGEARDKLVPQLARLDQRRAEIAADGLFATIAKPLAEHLEGLYVEYTSRYKSCGDADFQLLLAELPDVEPDLTKITVVTVNEHCASLTMMCTVTSLDIDGVLVTLGRERFETLRPFLANKLQQGLFSDFVTLYKVSGFLVLHDVAKAQDKAGMAQLVDLWGSLRKSFVTKVPEGSGYRLVARFVKMVCSAKSAWDAEKAVVQGKAAVQITVPGGVTVHTWEEFNGFAFPSSFTKGAYSTNECCIKHVHQEVGAAPSLQKLTAYFAEMVAACSAASVQYAKAKRANGVNCWSRQERARWHIIIGTQGQRKIFHVDSGYENSPWVNL